MVVRRTISTTREDAVARNRFRLMLRVLGGGSALALVTGVAAGQAQEPAPEAIVDAMEKNSGTHAGKRRSGAKGVCASGEFVSTGAGARLTSAVTFQPGNRVPLMARFSNGGGNPQAPDNAPAVRGMS